MNELMQGQLAEDTLPNLLQYLAMNAATGTLFLRHPKGMQGSVFFNKGAVVHIKLGAQQDVPALAALLSWPQGRFAFRKATALSERTVNSPLDKLLLEAAHLADTHKRSGGRLFSEHTVFVANSVPNQQRVAMTVLAVQLLRQIDGVHTLGEVAQRMNLAFDKVLIAAEELYGQAVIQPVAVAPVHPGFIPDLTKLIVNIMGPMGEIVVEDALYDLQLSSEDLPRSRVNDLLGELRAQFKREDWQQLFEAQVRGLCEHYGLAW